MMETFIIALGQVGSKETLLGYSYGKVIMGAHHFVNEAAHRVTL